MSKASGSIDLKSLKVAGEGATGYITNIDSSGIWITPSGSKPTNTSTGAGATGTRLNGDGLQIYKAGVQVASYGTDATIGQVAANLYNVFIDADSGIALRKNTTSLLTINSNQIDINDSSGNVMTRVDSNGLIVYDGNGTADANKVAIFGSTVQVGKKAVGYTTIASTGMDIYAGSSNVNLAHIGYDAVDEGDTTSYPYFTFGSRMADVTHGLGSYSIVAGLNNAANICSAAFGKNNKSTGGYSFTGCAGSEASGQYSIALGQGANATQTDQIAFGKFNDPGNSTAGYPRFSIGNGTSSSSRSNLFAIYASGYIDVRGKALNYNITPTISITTGSGYTLNTYTIRQYGNIVQLHIRVRNNSSTAIGGNLYSGTINTTALRPVMTTTSASYYDKYSFPATISTAGAIVVRNANATAFSALTGDNYVNVSFTYIVA